MDERTTNSPPSFAPASNLPGERPTNIRYGVLAFIGAMAFILYLDRVCIGQAESSIREELGINKEQMSWVMAAFTLAYALFEVPTGHLGDKYGARGVMTRIVVWWSIFTALTGTVFSLYPLILIRFLFGVGEAGAFPNSARVSSEWFPISFRGRAQGTITTLSLIGGAIAPVVTAVIIDQLGWRWTFGVYGLIGLIWAALFYAWYRDDPRTDPRVNEAERRLILAGREHEPQTSNPAHHAPIPWRLVLRSPNMWLLAGLMNCGAFMMYLVMSWFPTYLQEAHKITKVASGQYTSVVMASGAIGCFLGAWLTDFLFNRTGSLRISRCGIGVFSFAVGGVVLLFGVQSESPEVITAAFAFAAFCVQLEIPAWWGTVTQISGRHVGAMFGLMNSLGGCGAAGSQLFAGQLASYRQEHGFEGREVWDPVMYPYVGVMFLAAILWYFVRPETSIVEEAAAKEVAAT